jgi:hypothetical protein
MNQQEKAFCERVTVAGTHEAKFHTFEYVETILREGIPGDFVECGVFCGGHAAIASYVFRKWGVTDRKIHLFDSFCGIPKAGPQDCQDVHATYGTSNGTMETSGKCAIGIADVWKFFDQWQVPQSYLVFHPGWFQDVMESESKQISKIAFLRIDVDLYDSTKICYQNLYSKVSRGGVVVDDDWGFHKDDAPACRRAAIEVIGQPKNTVFEVQGHGSTSFWRIPT